MQNKFTIGQTVFFVPNDKRWNKPENVQITSIGRKWVEIGRHRFDKDTLRVDGGGYASPAKIYMSEESYKTEIEIKERWTKIFEKNKYSPPKNLSLSDIERIEKIIESKE